MDVSQSTVSRRLAKGHITGKSGPTQQELAKQWGVSQSTVSRRLSRGKIPGDEAVNAGDWIRKFNEGIEAVNAGDIEKGKKIIAEMKVMANHFTQ